MVSKAENSQSYEDIFEEVRDTDVDDCLFEVPFDDDDEFLEADEIDEFDE